MLARRPRARLPPGGAGGRLPESALTLSLTRGRSRQLTAPLAPLAVRVCRRSTQSRTVYQFSARCITRKAISARSTESFPPRSVLSRSSWLLLRLPTAADDFGHEVSEPQPLTP